MKIQNDLAAWVEDLAIFDASMNFVAINQSFNAIIARVVHHEQRGQPLPFHATSNMLWQSLCSPSTMEV